MPVLKLYLFGPPRLERAGDPLHIKRRKPKALLAYLASTLQSHSRESLAAFLWPEYDTRRARADLSRTLSILKKTLGEGWLEVDRETAGMNPLRPLWVDVAAFQELLAKTEGHGHPRESVCPACLPLLSEAADLYQADFLAGFTLPGSAAFDDWQLFQTEELRRKLIRALDRLAQGYGAQGEWETAIGHARRIVELEPLDEPAQRQLMRLYARSGQRAAALAQYELYRQRLQDELDIEPLAETQRLYMQVRDGGLEAIRHPAPTVVTGIEADGALGRELRHNLPHPSTSFVGRQVELDDIIRGLAMPNCRLLSVVGPGGMGKTRLALQTARLLVERFDPAYPDGVFLVPLAAVTSIDQLVPAIAEALGLSFSGPEDPQNQLLAFLQSKKLLLVLDNFDHLAEGAPVLVDFLERAPRIAVLVTSRVRLNLYEEWIIELQGLGVPEDDKVEDLEDYSAVQLFAERARQRELDFSLKANAASIVQICQLLEGMPLAIELAVGWVGYHSCEEILAEIQRGLTFLATDIINIPERHRSLRVTCEHSWRLLSNVDRKIFASLTVFQGGFDYRAAEKVAGATRQTMTRLVNNSMMHSAAGRYQIHAVLRQFGAERRAGKDASAVHERHAAYYAAFVQQREALRRTADEPIALREINIDLKNCLAAWDWALDRLADPGQAAAVAGVLSQFVPMLAYFYDHRSRFHEGVDLFLQARSVMEAHWGEPDRGGPLGKQKRLLLAQVRAREAALRFRLSEFDQVERLLAHSLPLLREEGALGEIAEALVCLGSTHVRTGAYSEAARCFQESLDLYRRLGERVASTEALNGLGSVGTSEGRFDDAQAFYEQCLAVYKETGYQRGMANSLSNLGTNYLRRGMHDRVMPFYQEALVAAQAAGEEMMIAVIRSNLGSVSRILKRFEDSVRYYEESLEMLREMGERRWTAASLNGLGLTLLDRGDPPRAKRYLLEGLEISEAIGSEPDSLDSIASLGEVLEREGAEGAAVAVLSFVVQHPLAKTTARERSERNLARLKTRLSPDEWGRALERGKSLTLKSVVEDLAGRGFS